MTTLTTPQSRVFFGVVLELAGTEIPLEPKNAITEIKQKGLEVELPPDKTVSLGTVGQRLKDIMDALGVEDTSFIDESTGSIKASSLPDLQAVQTLVNVLTQANLTIEEFHLRVPPTGTNTTVNKSETAYTVGLSATWTGDAGTLIESMDLKLKGLYLKVSNEEPAEDTTVAAAAVTTP